MSSLQLTNSTQRQASWMIRSAEFEKRSLNRSDVSFDVQVTPLDHQMIPVNSSFMASVLNYSETGACVQHREIIVEPFVQIEWEARQKCHRAVIKLKWCRATGNHCYLTGGRVISMESDDNQ